MGNKRVDQYRLDVIAIASVIGSPISSDLFTH